MQRFWDTLNKCRIIPAVKLSDPASAVPVARALYEGGLDVIEITFRTPAAAESISAIKKEMPEMLVGAGTVLSREQAMQAKHSGAEFIVAPGLNPTIIQTVLDMGLVMLPGIATPSEIETAMGFGLNAFKFFPAESLGGINTLKAFAGPYSGMRFLPTGGICAENLYEYLKTDNVFAVGGSWLTPEKLISNGEFDRIMKLAREAIAIVRQTCA